MTDAVDALRRELDDLVKGREDWLDTLNLRSPAGADPGRWRQVALEVLADLRLDGVEVTISPAAGPPWVAAATFTEGWAP